MKTSEIILIVLLCIVIVGAAISILLIIKKLNKNSKNSGFDPISSQEVLKGYADEISKRLELQHKKDMESLNTKIEQNSTQNKDAINEIKKTVTEDLNKNVDSKFNQTFKVIGEQLTNMEKAAGELKGYGSTADKLLRAMKNVKVSGVFGEAQLNNILDQFLSKGQYVTNFQAKDGQERVEFAVKFPTRDKEFVYLPIDSKFPVNVFADLIEAQKKGEESLINLKLSQLKTTINKMAKDIHDKYLNPPYTTTYGIMFLPTESLYVEVIKMGMLEEIQRKYQVTIAGPTTISAMLVSFMMGFKSFKIQQDAASILTMLSALKAQFSKMESEIKKINEGFVKSTNGFDKLLNTRFRMIRSKIQNIDEMSLDESDKLIGTNDSAQIDMVAAEENDKNEQ